MPKPTSNPRIDFRVPPQEKSRILKCAEQRQQTAADFARSSVLLAVEQQERGGNFDESALLRLTEQLDEIRQLLVTASAAGSRLEALAGASIASSALLRDDGRQSVEVGREAVGKHVRLALVAADHVVQTFNALLPSNAGGN